VSKVYLVALTGTDYSMRNRPETYRLRRVVSATMDRVVARAAVEELNGKMGSIEGENNAYAVIEVPETKQP
jgi:hypothetical protein